MEDTVDVQGTVIGIGTLLALFFLLYGTLVSETIVGVDTTTVAAWSFAGTFVAVALLHASVGQYNLAWGHGGAAAGWLFVLLGTGTQVLIGLLVLGLSGCYVVFLTLRHRREAATATA